MISLFIQVRIYLNEKYILDTGKRKALYFGYFNRLENVIY